MYKILASRWWTPLTTSALIGAVAIQSGDGWKAYIGTLIMVSSSASHDEQRIAQRGAKLTQQEASGIFPHLDASKYKN